MVEYSTARVRKVTSVLDEMDFESKKVGSDWSRREMVRGCE